MKNYILYTVCVLLVIATAAHAQQPSRDLSRFTGNGPLAPARVNAGSKISTAPHTQLGSRDLNRFAGKAPLAPGSGNTVARTNTAARKAAAVSVSLPSASSAAEKKQAAKSTVLPAGPPAAVTEQENAKPAVAPKAKTGPKPAPAKP